MSNQKSSKGAAPKIRAAQIDGAQLGDVNSSVNLYRGEVNLPLTLVSLPGRGGLNATVSAFYSSSVQSMITTWNQDGPTDVLGVGWNLLTSKIIADFKNTSSQIDGTFYLMLEGQSHELVYTKNIGVDRIYQTRDFNFLDIKYSPLTEIWTITNDSGMVYTFGGNLTKSGDHITGANYGHCGFGVAWDNWLGSSVRTSSETKIFVNQWNLGTVENLWGERVQYHYENDEVEIGSTGLKYTRASRLSRIIDVNSRSVQLEYEDKNDSEVQYPQVSPDGDNTNAFQFKYEKKYLKRILVKESIAPDARLLSKVVLDYEVNNLVNTADPNFDKRFLTSITNYSDQHLPLPAMKFSYYGSNAPNMGALKEILYPKGSVATYSYDTVEVDSDYLHTEITAPDNGYSRPKIWTGTDYVVIGWWKDRHVILKTYTWDGSWIDPAQAGLIEEITFSEVDKREDFEVVTMNDYFTVTYKVHNDGNHLLYLYHKDPYRNTQWLGTQVNTNQHNEGLTLATGENWIVFAEQHTNEDNHKEIRLDTCQWNPVSKTWDETRSLTASPFRFNRENQTEAKHFHLVANNNFFVLWYRNTHSDNAKMILYYQDESKDWQESPTKELDLPNTNVHIDWDAMYEDAMMSAGDTFVSFSYIKETDGSSLHHYYSIIDWDSSYAMRISVNNHNFTEPAQMGFQAPRVSGALIGVGNHLYRFDGVEWKSKETEDSDSERYYTAFGSDSALVGIPHKGQYRFYRYNYNPYHYGSNVWETEEKILDVSSDGDLHPTIQGNYATLGRRIYYRQNNTKWHYLGDHSRLHDKVIEVNNFAPTYLLGIESDDDARVYYLDNDQLRPNGNYKLENKTVVAGLESLITYDVGELEDAESLTLYRFTSEGTFGEVPVVPFVSRLDVNNGKQTISTCYRFHRDDLTIDPYTQINRFSKVTSCYGDLSDQTKDGYTISEFYDGKIPSASNSEYPDLSDTNNVVDFYSLLEGQLYRKTDYDSSDVRVRQLDTHFMAVETEDRHSAHVNMVRTRQWRDGIVLTTDYEYNERGQVTCESVYNINSIGDSIRVDKCKTYGWEENPQMNDVNLMNVVVDERTVLNNLSQNGDPVIKNIKRSLYKNEWGHSASGKDWALYQVYEWNGMGTGDDFSDDLALMGNLSSGWIKTAENRSYNQNGQAIETLDNNENCTTVLYDREHKFPIATFKYAASNEAFYNGFEPYEDISSWQLNKGAIMINECFTGSRSVRLIGAGELRGNFQNINTRRDYVLGCWIKTEEGFNEGIQAQLNYGLTGLSDHNFPIEATGGEWKYQIIPVSFEGAYPDQGSLQVIIFNNSNKQVLVDNVSFYPTDGGFTADVYEGKFYLKTSTIGIGGAESFSFYDHFQRPVFSTDHSRQLRETTSSYMWRSQGDDLTAGIFNYILGVRVKGSSSVTSFKDPRWLDQWSLNTTSYQQIGGKLIISSNTGGTNQLDLNDQLQGTTFALRFQLSEYFETNPADVDEFEIKFGAFTVLWQENKWSLVQNGVAVSGANSQYLSQITQDCLLIVNDNSVLFIGNGALLIQYRNESNPILDGTGGHDLSIKTSNDLALEYIVLGYEPITAVSYQDGSDQSIQSQILDNTKCSVFGLDYDRNGQQTIVTKPAKFDSMFAYQTSLVESFNASNGSVNGTINISYPDDEGYPFSRSRYEASPLARLLEKGSPGKRHAIRNDIPLSDRHTCWFNYGINDSGSSVASFFPELPSDQYFYNIVCDANGIKKADLIDRFENTIATCAGMTSDEFGGEGSIVSRHVYDLKGRPIKTIMPNAYANNNRPSLTSTEFVEETEYDFFGRITQVKLPDIAEPDEFVYTFNGVLRYKRSAETNYYFLHDTMGRVIETGVTSMDWQTLVDNADNPTFQLSDKVVVNSYEYYDHFNGEQWEFGMLKEVQNSNSLSTSYEYDVHGRTTDIEQICGDLSTKFEYSYNQLDQTTLIVDANNRNLYKAKYNYNAVGQLSNADIITNTKTAGVEFEYHPNGSIKRRSLYHLNERGQKVDSIIEGLKYDSVGNLTELDNNFFQEKLFYHENINGIDTGWNAGRITRVQSLFKQGLSDSDFINEYSFDYNYDHLGRLTSAEMWSNGMHQPNYSLGDPNSTYDANGNCKSFKEEGVSTVTEFNPSTNQLSLVSSNNGNEAFYYNANGNVYQSPTLALNRNKYTNNLQTVYKQDDTHVAFDYNGDGIRIKKKYLDATTHYGLGINNEVLSTTEYENDIKKTTKYYLNTPLGLEIISIPVKDLIESEHPFKFVLKDHLGSVRIIVDQHTNQVAAAFSYLPFGKSLGEVFGDQTLCDYRFTGQEWDAEIELYNFRKRMYDPKIGRFYSRDPQMQFFSPYLYAGNNPILFNDPTGEWSWNAFGGALAGLGLATLGFVCIGVSGALDVTGVLAVAGAGLGVLGAGLVGFGIAGLTYSLSNFSDDSFSWKTWGLESLIGGAVGVITAGMATDYLAVGELLFENAESDVALVAKAVTSVANRSLTGSKLSKGIKFGRFLVTGSIYTLQSWSNFKLETYDENMSGGQWALTILTSFAGAALSELIPSPKKPNRGGYHEIDAVSRSATEFAKDAGKALTYELGKRSAIYTSVMGIDVVFRIVFTPAPDDYDPEDYYSEHE